MVISAPSQQIMSRGVGNQGVCVGARVEGLGLRGHKGIDCIGGM